MNTDDHIMARTTALGLAVTAAKNIIVGPADKSAAQILGIAAQFERYLIGGTIPDAPDAPDVEPTPPPHDPGDPTGFITDAIGPNDPRSKYR